MTDRHDTSLAKNSLNSASNNDRRTAFLQSTDEFKLYRQSLPKTAASISSKA